ncbi:hypothetical protein GGI23_001998, partial [Coemansia sp. RSA 2559]
QFKVLEVLFPIFQPDPNSYLYGTIPVTSPTSAAGLPTSSDPYSAAAAATGYSQLAATRAQEAYDPANNAAAAAAVAAAVNTPTATSGTTPAGSSTASHSHSASLTQAMVSPNMLHQSQHHHSMSQSNLQQAASQQQGLGITYISSPPRLAGIPSSPPMSAMSTGAISPSSSYIDKNSRFTPYGSGGFQTTTSKSGAGSKRGSIDHHYQPMHTPLLQQHNSHSATQTIAPAHHPQQQQQDGTSADQDAAQQQQQQQQQQSAVSSSYFEGLLAKNEQ